MSKKPSLFLVPFLLTVSAPALAVTSAELYRPAGHTFGRFEARVQFAPGDGVISSFFLWKEGSEQSSVYWNELDFEKLGAGCELQTNSIYGLPQSNHEGDGYSLEGLCDGYHTYAYEWTPTYIAWFVDGTEIRRETGAGVDAYAENATDGLQFRFNIWPGNASFGGTFSEATLPVYQYVAWAQYSEYTPGAGAGGADFTLAWREEFDGPPAGWQMGSWGSPLNGSTHSAANVTFVDGIAVLALTADDATGYTGTPPADLSGGAGAPSTGGATGEPSTGGATGEPSTGGATGAGTPATGGAAAATGGAAAGLNDDGGDGCSCRVAPRRLPGAGALALLAAVVGLLGRRRARATGAGASRRAAGELG